MKSLMSLNSQALDASAALRMLSIIQQRYPTVLAKIASKISQEESISADFVDQLIVSLSAVRDLCSFEIGGLLKIFSP